MPRRFDERVALRHNLRPVQRPRFLVRLAALAWLGLATASPGCDKPDDQPVLHQELLATAKDYDRRLDELADRADEIDRRLARRRQELPRVTLDGAAAEHRLAQARSVIADRRGYLTGVRARLTGGTPGSVPELHGLLDEMRARLSDGLLEATADLAAVEGWLAARAQRERAGAQPPAADSEPAPATSAPGSEDDAPETDSSGAPIR